MASRLTRAARRGSAFCADLAALWAERASAAAQIAAGDAAMAAHAVAHAEFLAPLQHDAADAAAARDAAAAQLAELRTPAGACVQQRSRALCFALLNAAASPPSFACRRRSASIVRCAEAPRRAEDALSMAALSASEHAAAHAGAARSLRKRGSVLAGVASC